MSETDNLIKIIKELQRRVEQLEKLVAALSKRSA